MVHEYHSAGTPGFFDAAAADGEVQVVVIGDPFDAPQGETARIVAGILEKVEQTGPQARFVPTDPKDLGDEALVMVLFDPPRTQQAWRLCGGYLSTTPAHGDGRLHLMVALCIQGEAIASVEANLVRPVTADAPEMASVLGQAMALLVPYQDPVSEPDLPD